MAEYGFSTEDLQQIEERNIPLADIHRQLETFARGIAFIKLDRPATVSDGIKSFDSADFGRLLESHRGAAAAGRLTKFVPASGAASRMFKALLKLLNEAEDFDLNKLKKSASSGDEDAEFGVIFFENIAEFAFYGSLRDTIEESGQRLEKMVENGDLQRILELLLTEKGMNYAQLPKGLIEFHGYGESGRTPFGEHIFEGLSYAADENGKVRLHFTVTEEHSALIEGHICAIIDEIGSSEPAAESGITYSIQKKSTDTIAADLNNRPFRDAGGQLLFRPAGHGALIENLNDLKAEIVYINNIDNVRPEAKMGDTYLYKKLLCGYLAELQEGVFGYLRDLEGGGVSQDRIAEIRRFTEEVLTAHVPDDFDEYDADGKNAYLFGRLNRPLRVCGMVKNLGDPGGGPFWVEDRDGGITLQIVESSQIDGQNPVQKQILDSATHFNPVDLVCGLRDYQGRQFNLLEFVDQKAGFITVKSWDGRELKALERPGLWNGAMAYWNTVFVEVPVTTFSPVKTVNDLLKAEHR